MRTADYQNAEYDRKLAEYKALKAKMRAEQEGNSGTTNSSTTNSSRPSTSGSSSSSVRSNAPSSGFGRR